MTKSTELSESELIRKFKDDPASRQSVFAIILNQSKQKVYWHVRRIVIDHDDADDVTQNTFIKVWGNLENFREDSKLFTWIFKIATNEALAFLKRKRTRSFFSLNDVEKEFSEKITEGEWFSGTDIERKLQLALLQLPEKQRIVFNMKYYDDMKYEEISEILGTSVGALKASYHHAVKKIEKFLEGN